jgi:hypothetical protein
LTLVPSGQEIEHVSTPLPSWSHSFCIALGFFSHSFGHSWTESSVVKVVNVAGTDSPFVVVIALLEVVVVSGVVSMIR